MLKVANLNGLVSLFACIGLLSMLISSQHAFDRMSDQIDRARNVRHLVSRLNATLDQIELKRSKILLEKHTIVGPGLPRAIGKLLLGTIQSGKYLTVGVTGGSSTGGDFSWPKRFVNFLSRHVEVPNLELRNAAMGSTSQLVTSPCIQTLVGSEVDILFWEFGMNDEPGIWQAKDNSLHLRHRVAEAYIRQAVALNPPAMGFVHFWDLNIHTWQPGNMTDLPDRSFHPTSTIMRYYQPVYDRYFAANVIGFLTDAGMYREKKDFLRDDHHPNALGYDVAVDLLAYCILKAALDFFTLGGSTEEDLSIRSSALAQNPIWAYPLMSYETENSPHALPSQRIFGHCLTALRPTFSRYNTIRVIENDGHIVDTGKAAPGRNDRQTQFDIGPCANASRFSVSIDVPNIAYVIVSCGGGVGAQCDHIEARFDDIGTIRPNVDVADDVMGYFYSWVHKMDEIMPNAQRRLHLCSRSQTALLARLVILERV